MVIRKESKLADLISSSGLVGASCQVKAEQQRVQQCNHDTFDLHDLLYNTESAGDGDFR